MRNPLPTRIECYDDAIRWLYDRIDYERTRPSAHSNPFRLERIERLLQRVGAPHERIPAVHIAGTKGKGSTAAMVDSILQTAGIRTGLFTSPHIEQFEERMRVSGHMPNADQLTRLVARLCQVLQEAEMDVSDRIPTFFEVTTLLAWMLFDEEQVQIAVLETGLGGRLDCTNVCRPLVTVITSIGLDHTHILGDTISKIAWEKAGILKAGVPVVQGQLPGDADYVVESRARDLACPRFVCGRDFAWHDAGQEVAARVPKRSQKILVLTPCCNYEDLTVPLLGRHQAHNASLAIMTANLLRDGGYPQITADAITEGIRTTHWPLRFEILDGHPTIVLDAAHNPDSMRAVAGVLDGAEWQGRRRILVFAASADKDAASMLSIIVPNFDEVVLTRFIGNPRSVPPEQLQALVDGLDSEPFRHTQFHQASDPPSAIAKARQLAGHDGLICVTGSLFLAAEARVHLLKSGAR
jgi:dihydrofolate synthase/folylpolyglutamate synthase